MEGLAYPAITSTGVDAINHFLLLIKIHKRLSIFLTLFRLFVL